VQVYPELVGYGLDGKVHGLEFVARYPGRFRAFAAVPLPHIGTASQLLV
jgi:hypothetical protein